MYLRLAVLVFAGSSWACKPDEPSKSEDPETPSDPPDEDGDGDGISDGEDCGSADPHVHPGADERCNSIDDDCDGTADEDPVDAPAWFADADGDGWGEGGPVMSCEAPTAGHVARGGDCDDAEPWTHPDAFDLPGDGVDSDCVYGDADDMDCERQAVHAGNVTFEGPDAAWEMRDFCSRYNVVDGDVVVTGIDASRVKVLECLCSVGGDLQIIGNPDLTVIEGGADLVGELRVADNAALTVLRWTSDALGAAILDNPALVDVDLDLGDAVGTVAVSGNGTAAELDVEVSGDLLGDVIVAGNPGLVSLTVRGDLSPAAATGSIRVEDNPVLEDAGIVWFEAIDGDLIIARNPLLSAGLLIEFLLDEQVASCNDRLQTIGGDLVIEDNPLLPHSLHVSPQYDASCLASVGGDVRVARNPLLDPTFLDHLAQIGGDLWWEANEDVPYDGSFFPALLSVGGNVALQDGLAGDGVFESLVSVGGDLSLWGFEYTHDASDFEALASVGGDLALVASGNDGIVTLGALASVGGSVDALLEGGMNASQLQSVGGDVSLVTTGDRGTWRIGAAELQGDLTVARCVLNDSEIAVSTVAGDVRFEGCIVFDGSPVEVQGLQDVGGDLVLLGNDVPDLRFLGDLRSVGGDFDVLANDDLVSFAGLGALERISGELYVDYNLSLVTTDGLDALTEVDRVWMDRNPALTTIAGLDDVTTLSALVFTENDALVSLEGLVGLEDVGLFYLWDNAALVTLDGLEGLRTASAIEIYSNGALADVSALHGLTFVTTLRIIGNPSLPAAAAQALVDEIDVVVGSVDVSDNGP